MGLYMKHIYAFESLAEAKEYETVIQNFKTKLDQFELHLKEHFKLEEPPKGIVWTSGELATETFSEIPIPAYTNKDIVYMSPEKSDWQSLYSNMLIDVFDDEIEDYYKKEAENLIITIAGHELTHHIELFVDDFDDYGEGIWFEEGMCDYISRKFFLSDSEFKALHDIEVKFIDYYMDQFGDESIENFGTATYDGSLHYIMFQYARSFALVTYLVEEKFGDIHAVFEHYEKWHKNGRKGKLVDHFGVAHLYMDSFF